MVRPADPDTRSAVRRVVQLLDALAADDAELSIRDLAERTGIPRSSVHRFVGELVATGLAERGPAGVRLGTKLFEYGAAAPTSRTLRDAAAPFLHTLYELTSLTVNLAVRDGASILYLDKIAARRTRVPHSRPGGRGAVHATALGKVLLAFSGTAPTDLAFADRGLPALTEHTITSAARLSAELAAVRRAGVAYDVEESHQGLFCVAAPIRDPAGAAVAAVAVTGATALTQAERYSTTVMATARAIEHELTRRRRRRHPRPATRS